MLYLLSLKQNKQAEQENMKKQATNSWEIYTQRFEGEKTNAIRLEAHKLRMKAYKLGIKSNKPLYVERVA